MSPFRTEWKDSSVLAEASFNVTRRNSTMHVSDLDARIVMQVHDEVIVELNEACFSTAVERIESAMLNALPEFLVPLSVKISSGTNWGSLLPLNS